MLKLFDNFKAEGDVDFGYITAKMEEIGDLVSSMDDIMDYKISTDKLEISIGTNWNKIIFDFNEMVVYQLPKAKFNMGVKKVDSVEQGLDIIEHNIHRYFGITENEDENEGEESDLSSDDERFDDDDKINENKMNHLKLFEEYNLIKKNQFVSNTKKAKVSK